MISQSVPTVSWHHFFQWGLSLSRKDDCCRTCSWIIKKLIDFTNAHFHPKMPLTSQRKSTCKWQTPHICSVINGSRQSKKLTFFVCSYCFESNAVIWALRLLPRHGKISATRSRILMPISSARVSAIESLSDIRTKVRLRGSLGLAAWRVLQTSLSWTETLSRTCWLTRF